MEHIKKEFNGFSIAGFILSFFGLLSIFAIIFCIIAIIQTRKYNQRGKGLAIAGLIIGLIVLAFSIFSLLSFYVPFNLP